MLTLCLMLSLIDNASVNAYNRVTVGFIMVDYKQLHNLSINLQTFINLQNRVVNSITQCAKQLSCSDKLFTLTLPLTTAMARAYESDHKCNSILATS